MKVAVNGSWYDKEELEDGLMLSYSVIKKHKNYFERFARTEFFRVKATI